jgi:hypothetical protein
MKLDTTNGHNEIVIDKFNDISKHFTDVDLAYHILTHWADDEDIESITEFLNNLIKQG